MKLSGVVVKSSALTTFSEDDVPANLVSYTQKILENKEHRKRKNGAKRKKYQEGPENDYSIR